MLTGSIGSGGIGVLTGIMIAGGWSIVPPIVLGVGLAAGGAWLGNRIQKKTGSLSITMNTDAEKEKKYLETLSKRVVLANGFVADGNLDHFAKNSRVIRRAFPDKHLRISFGLSIGPNMTRKSLENMLASTTLAPMTEYRKGPLAMEFFDVAWRFSDRFIAGGQVSLNLDSYAQFYNADYKDEIYYSCEVRNFQGRIYFEYAPWPVTRSFTKKHEILFGGGLIFSSPSSVFYYSYIPNLVNGNRETIERIHDPELMGFQLRSSIQYYLFPGFSVSAGLEGNIVQPLKVESYKLPTSDPQVSVTIPDYQLNFSTIRLKVSTSIYF